MAVCKSAFDCSRGKGYIKYPSPHLRIGLYIVDDYLFVDNTVTGHFHASKDLCDMWLIWQ